MLSTPAIEKTARNAESAHRSGAQTGRGINGCRAGRKCARQADISSTYLFVGLPKLKSTLGGFSEPAGAWKYGFGAKCPNPAMNDAGNCFIAVLYCCTAVLNRWRS